MKLAINIYGNGDTTIKIVNILKDFHKKKQVVFVK